MSITWKGALRLSSELLQGSGARKVGERGEKSNREVGDVFLSAKREGRYQKMGLVYARQCSQREGVHVGLWR